MAYSPGALIVDEKYENEDQQFLEEIHINRSSGSSRMDVDQIGDGMRSTPVTERSQQPAKGSYKHYSDRQSIVASTSNYDETEYAPSTSDQFGSRPGPMLNIETEDNSENKYGDRDQIKKARASWVPPTFRTCRPSANISWCAPKVRHILRKFRDKQVSIQQAAQMFKSLTGAEISLTTIRSKSRILDELDAQYDENVQNPIRPNSVDSVEDAAEEDAIFSRENRKRKYPESTLVKPGVNAPITAPSEAPYYISFSHRYKQTSLTVPLNQDEVRLYRHASHSKSGRTIHFRCSRCDTLCQAYKNGTTARVKMIDGVVVSQLFPEHHPLCKPIKLVEARAKEIERQCRKEIIRGVNPKEAWKKGRRAAITEANTMGFPVYGPGSILSAFPEWEKCKVVFGALRSRYIRRQINIKQRGSAKGAKNDLDSINKKGVDVTAFDTSESYLPKRAWVKEGRYPQTSEGEDLIDADLGIDEFEAESLYNFMHSVKSSGGHKMGVAEATSSGSSNKSARLSVIDTDNPVKSSEKDHLKRNENRSSDIDESTRRRMAMEVQEVERAIARASTSVGQLQSDIASQSRISHSHRSTPSSTPSAIASAGAFSDDRSESIKKSRREKLPDSYDDYITFVSPAGVLPCARKKHRYNEKEAVCKLREIEKCIAQYNALSDQKIATIHAAKTGELKFFGSKYIIDACLHSSICANLKKKLTTTVDDDDGEDDDELISIPLLKCRSNLEVNLTENSGVRPLLNNFLSAMHFPWKPWFDNPHCPDYWPMNVPFYDPNNDLLSVSKLSKHKDLENHSIVDLERDILKYAFRHYCSFMEYHFGLTGPRFDDGPCKQVEDDKSVKKVCIDESVIDDNETIADPPVGTRQNDYNDDVAFTIDDDRSVVGVENAVACAPAAFDRCLDDQLSVYGNAALESKHNLVLRIRYETMGEDVRAIAESVSKIQAHSTCKVLVIFFDERHKLSVTGDKTLISAFLNSNISQCIPTAISFAFDNQVISLPLLQLYDDSMIDQIDERHALDLLDDIMQHINFPWSDPYEGSQPDCWPPEIPFYSPWTNGGRGILNRRIGANTPGQAAKIVLKSVHWFYTEFMVEKLKSSNGLGIIAPMLAELSHCALAHDEAENGDQTPAPRTTTEFSSYCEPLQTEIMDSQNAPLPTRVEAQPSHHPSVVSHMGLVAPRKSRDEVRSSEHRALGTGNPNQIAMQFSNRMAYDGISSRHHRRAPLSPSQHSISSQETVPFRLPPQAILEADMHGPAKHRVLQEATAHSSSYIVDNASVSTVTAVRTQTFERHRQMMDVAGTVGDAVDHSAATADEFRVPLVPPVCARDRTAQWTSQHSSVVSIHRTSEASYDTKRKSTSRGTVSSPARHSQRTSPFGVGHSHSRQPKLSAQTSNYTTSESSMPDDSAVFRAPAVPRSYLSSVGGSIASTGQDPYNKSEQEFLKVLCSCGPGVELDSRDCLRCDRCKKYFHSKCLPLRQQDKYFVCLSCVPHIKPR